MNDLLHSLCPHLPERLRVERQGTADVFSVFTGDTWIPVYQTGSSSGWWLHGERHLEYGLREEAEQRGWAWHLESTGLHAQARVSGSQRMCSGQGHPPVHNLACALLDMLEQTA